MHLNCIIIYKKEKEKLALFLSLSFINCWFVLIGDDIFYIVH